MSEDKEKLARAVNPNPSIRVWYRKQLERLIEALRRSTFWWLRARYKTGKAKLVQRELDALRHYWGDIFDDSAKRIAKRFVEKIDRHVSNSARNALAELSFNVTWKNSSEVKNVLTSLRDTQVSLIKSIPEESLNRVSGVLQRGLQNGQDINQITEELSHGFGITERRAKMIALDQTNKATFSINRARMLSVGVTEGIWIHVAGRYTSRPTHVAMHHKRFNLSEGLFDSAVGKNVMPAELVNCCCKWRAIIKPKYSSME